MTIEQEGDKASRKAGYEAMEVSKYMTDAQYGIGYVENDIGLRASRKDHMTTDTIEPETQEVATIPMTAPAVEVGAEVDVPPPDDHDHEIARAENEGMLGKPLPVPAEAPESPAIASPGEDVESITPAMKIALASLYDVQDRLDAAISDHEAKAEVAKTAKKRAESLQADLSDAVRKVRNIKKAGEPDPINCPLFDGPKRDPRKAEIDAAFPAPESIAPLSAEDFDEHLRRRQRDTPTDQLDLDKRTLKVLVEDLGLKTVGDVVRKWNDVLGSGGKLSSMKGITDARQESIATALAEFSEAAQAEWDAAHSEMIDAEIDQALDDTAEEDEIAPDSDEEVIDGDD